MADVEMKEAAGSSKGKAVAKADTSDKKKFEVKKVPRKRHQLERHH
jgi:RING-box protein 1